jgi:hypothetical protein
MSARDIRKVGNRSDHVHTDDPPSDLGRVIIHEPDRHHSEVRPAT